MKPSAPSGTVVSNSGPLIALAKVNQIHLLYPLYGTVSIPAAVYEEAALAGLARGEADALSIEMAYLNRHLQVVELTENQLSAGVTNLPLDWGEKYAIQLAINEKAELLLLDDLQARNEAKKFGFKIKGTLGVLVDAARQNLLTLPELELVFETIQKREDIWIAEDLLRGVWNSLRTQKAKRKKQ